MQCSKLGAVLTALNRLPLVGKHVVIGCTVLPGYVRKIGRALLKDCMNTSLSYSPEFIQQGDIVRGFLNPDMVLVGEGNQEVSCIEILSSNLTIPLISYAAVRFRSVISWKGCIGKSAKTRHSLLECRLKVRKFVNLL